MPQIRPDAISNCIRLANEVAALVRSLIPERRTIDSRLPDACSLVDTGVDKESPNKKSIPCRCPQCDVFSWSNELLGSSSIFVLVTRVMSFIKFSASRVAVLCQPPQRSIVVFYDWIHIHNYARAWACWAVSQAGAIMGLVSVWRDRDTGTFRLSRRSLTPISSPIPCHAPSGSTPTCSGLRRMSKHSTHRTPQ